MGVQFIESASCLMHNRCIDFLWGRFFIKKKRHEIIHNKIANWARAKHRKQVGSLAWSDSFALRVTIIHHTQHTILHVIE